MGHVDKRQELAVWAAFFCLLFFAAAKKSRCRPAQGRRVKLDNASRMPAKTQPKTQPKPKPKNQEGVTTTVQVVPADSTTPSGTESIFTLTGTRCANLTQLN